MIGSINYYSTINKLTMERFNIFNQIHKGLRAALYDTALQLQQADFTSASESESALEKVREVVMLFDEHAHKEDTFVLPAILQYEPSVVDAFEQEHVADLALARQLSDAVKQLDSLLKAADREAAGRKLNVIFVEFVAFNLKHMAKEEDVINNILWRYYTDGEILQIQNRIVESTEPWHQDFFSKWMLRGINNTEAAAWLMAVQRIAPSIVYQTLFNKARQEYSKKRFQHLVESLQENVVLN
jgi:hemerythrin-like domain-containing protein